MDAAECRESLLMNYSTFDEMRLQRHRARVVRAEMKEQKSDAQSVNSCC